MNKCPECGNSNLSYVQYADDDEFAYAGVSEIFCMDCSASYGRWCGKRLGENEGEPKFCKGQHFNHNREE